MGNARTLRLKNILGYEPIMPRVQDLDPSQVVVRYNDESDTLYVSFSDPVPPSISVDLNEYLYLRVDDESHRVVGVQIEGYRAYAVQRDPLWLVWGELSGIPRKRLTMRGGGST